jgi:polysaccharide biosynthesis transport protein
MLDNTSFAGQISGEPNVKTLPGQSLSLSRLFDVLWRRKLIVIAGAALGLALALAYISLVPSRYMATAQLLMDTRRADQPAAYVNIDQSTVESQIETLRSQRIALGVIDKLALANDPEFNRRGLVTRVFSAIGLEDAPPQTAAEQLRKTIDAFRRQLTVSRVGPSYVANVAFLSTDRDKAALIANEVVDTYIEDQLSARVLSLERSNSWTQKRSAELRKQAEQAVMALDAFKAQSAATLIGQANRTKLEELTALAQDSKRSFDTFQNLVRYVQTNSERTFPATDARVLAQASPPLTASSPNKPMALVLMLVMGAGLGMLAAFACEKGDNRLRRAGQLETQFGVKALGLLPFVATEASSGTSHSHGRRLLTLSDSEATGSPLSDLSINVQLAVDRAGAARPRASVIGVTSARAQEGKSTVAFNLATAMGSSGLRVLLVDWNLRSPLLTEALEPDYRREGADPRKEVASLERTITRHGAVDFLPVQPGNGHPATTLRSAIVRTWLKEAGERYDYVLVDLPSTLDYVDVQACADSFGSILFVADFARTRIDDLQQAFDDDAIMSRILGVVVTRTSAASRFDVLHPRSAPARRASPAVDAMLSQQRHGSS